MPSSLRNRCFLFRCGPSLVRGTDEDVGTILKFSSLGSNTDSSVDGDDRELTWLVLDFGDLLCELSCRREHDGLDLAYAKESVRSQVLDNWESEGEGLARACQV